MLFLSITIIIIIIRSWNYRIPVWNKWLSSVWTQRMTELWLLEFIDIRYIGSVLRVLKLPTQC